MIGCRFNFLRTFADVHEDEVVGCTSGVDPCCADDDLHSCREGECSALKDAYPFCRWNSVMVIYGIPAAPLSLSHEDFELLVKHSSTLSTHPRLN